MSKTASNGVANKINRIIVRVSKDDSDNGKHRIAPRNGEILRAGERYTLMSGGKALPDPDKLKIHHINLNPKDNHHMNLLVTNEDQAEKQHTYLHRQLDAINHLLIKSGIINFNYRTLKYEIAFKPLVDKLLKWFKDKPDNDRHPEYDPTLMESEQKLKLFDESHKKLKARKEAQLELGFDKNLTKEGVERYDASYIHDHKRTSAEQN